MSDSRRNADLRGLTECIVIGFRVKVCGISGPRMRRTGGTLICGLEIPWDRGFWILDCAKMDGGAAWARKAWVPAGRRSRSVPFSKCRPSNGKKNLRNLVEIRLCRSLQ